MLFVFVFVFVFIFVFVYMHICIFVQRVFEGSVSLLRVQVINGRLTKAAYS